MFISKDPYSGETFQSLDFQDNETTQKQIQLAEEAFANLGSLSIDERAGHLRSLALKLKSDVEELALIITEEMGKPIAQSRAEIMKCAWLCEWVAAMGPNMLKDELLFDMDGTKAFTRRDPLGAVLAIMPWNFPFWQLFRFAVPAVLAGNVVLLKHAPNVLRSALAMERLFIDAGFPQHSLQNLFIDIDQVESVLADPFVAGTTLTGSTRAGKAAAALAGKHLKKHVLELGGSDPFIVLPSANIDSTVMGALAGRFQNNGQSCIAAKRFIVHEDLKDSFLEALTSRLGQFRIGDPKEEDTNISCMARQDLKEDLEEQVNKSIEMGAKLAFQSEEKLSSPAYYPPTILIDVPVDSPAWKEELFGPVLSLTSYSSEDEMISLANDTIYGLGASIWAADTSEAEALISKIQSGNIFVNEIVKSDPRIPFGGIKQSGYGKELGREGLLEFTNSKTVSIRYK